VPDLWSVPQVRRWQVRAGSRHRLDRDEQVQRYVVSHISRANGVDCRPEPLRHISELRPGCAVAVCTYKRPETVVRFLESLATQDQLPEQLLVIDASPDDATEQALHGYAWFELAAKRVDYLRVTGPLAGLTAQRNVALRYAITDLIAFFDDDIVLLPGCLAAMQRAHHEHPGLVVGAAAVLLNEQEPPPPLWRVRAALRIVPTLRPGSYTRSGFQIPWRFLPLTEEVVPGDWLPGGATMWRTALAREVGFHEGLDGYANGEDLEFSLQMGSRGRTVLVGAARVLHLQEWSGRPNDRQMGYMGLRNQFYIHQTCLPGRERRDTAYFIYGYGLDTLVRLLALLRPGNVRVRWEFLLGRLHFIRQLLGLTRD
jgi:GT2 family glycosyltransferase